MKSLFGGMKNKIQKNPPPTSNLSITSDKTVPLKQKVSQKIFQRVNRLKNTFFSVLENQKRKLLLFLSKILNEIISLLKVILTRVLKIAEDLYKIILIENSSLSQFVYGAGIYNLVLVLCYGLPEGTIDINVNIVDHALSELLAGYLLFTAVIQIIGSRDLNLFGWAIYWQGLLRWFAGFLFSIYGFLGHLGIVAGIIGLIDIYIGSIYLTRLPEVTKKSPRELLTGK